jgi:nucleoside-diphosphate-sugar epimerase
MVKSNHKIFITGADGFVGKSLVQELSLRSIPFIAGTRQVYGDISHPKNWEILFKDSDTIVHLAARVHVMDEKENNPLKAFREINVEATLEIAIAAKKKGIKRFIFISTIKVNGEKTLDSPFTANDKPNPQDPYGISKLEAEEQLMLLHEPGSFEVVIIRPPLIYGPGVKASMEKLFWLVKNDLPLPFGRVANKRSLVSVFNLCDLIVHCFDHPAASGEIFLVSDDRDYSIRELLILMAKTLDKTPHLLSVPVFIMKNVLKLSGKTAYADRLFSNLQLDITKTKTLLGWHPHITFEETYKN